MAHEVTHLGYTLSDDPARLDPNAIHSYLSRSYWAEQIPLETVKKAMENSFCAGLYAPDGTQAGLARVITDYTTFAYLCDVYVLEAHRGQGLSKKLIDYVIHHPRLQGLRRFNLVTRDAHTLYAQFGFNAPSKPEAYMEKLNSNVYRKGGDSLQA